MDRLNTPGRHTVERLRHSATNSLLTRRDAQGKPGSAIAEDHLKDAVETVTLDGVVPRAGDPDLGRRR